MFGKHIAVALGLIAASLVSVGALADEPAATRVQPVAPLEPAATRVRPGALFLKCVVQGTPVEFPDDILLTNVSTATIPAGTKIHWDAKAYSGDYTFTEALPKNGNKYLNGVLQSGLEASAPCTAVKK